MSHHFGQLLTSIAIYDKVSGLSVSAGLRILAVGGFCAHKLHFIYTTSRTEKLHNVQTDTLDKGGEARLPKFLFRYLK